MRVSPGCSRQTHERVKKGSRVAESSEATMSSAVGEVRRSTDRRERQTVGVRLKALRLDRGWSQRDLAALCQMTNGSLSMIEQGKVSPSVTSLEKILSVYELSLAEFFAQTGLASSPFLDEKDVRQLEERGIKVQYFTLKEGDAVASAPQMLRLVMEPRALTQFAWLPRQGLFTGMVQRGPVEIRIDGRSFQQQRGAFRFSLARQCTLTNLSRVQAEVTATYLP